MSVITNCVITKDLNAFIIKRKNNTFLPPKLMFKLIEQSDKNRQFHEPKIKGSCKELPLTSPAELIGPRALYNNRKQ